MRYIQADYVVDGYCSDGEEQDICQKNIQLVKSEYLGGSMPKLEEKRVVTEMMTRMEGVERICLR